MLEQSRPPDPPPALEELTFLYQPVAPLGDGPAWSEALIRWPQLDGTVRGPAQILPHWLAPSRVELFTRFTIASAARVIADNQGERISINLSPEQALLPETLRTLRGLLPSVARGLHIEITEQAYPNACLMTKRVSALKEHCGIVLLDDVTPHDLGSRLLPGTLVDGVKIDRRVLRALTCPPAGPGANEAREFVEELTNRYEYVIAEGVEDPNTCEELKALGVSHVQGFGIARPSAELRSAATALDSSATRRAASGAAAHNNAVTSGKEPGGSSLG